MKAAGAPQEHCETESEIETADRPKQWNGIRAAQTGTPRDDTRLGRLLQVGGYEKPLLKSLTNGCAGVSECVSGRRGSARRHGSRT